MHMNCSMHAQEHTFQFEPGAQATVKTSVTVLQCCVTLFITIFLMLNCKQLQGEEIWMA